MLSKVYNAVTGILYVSLLALSCMVLYSVYRNLDSRNPNSPVFKVNHAADRMANVASRVEDIIGDPPKGKSGKPVTVYGIMGDAQDAIADARRVAVKVDGAVGDARGVMAHTHQVMDKAGRAMDAVPGVVSHLHLVAGKVEGAIGDAQDVMTHTHQVMNQAGRAMHEVPGVVDHLHLVAGKVEGAIGDARETMGHANGAIERVNAITGPIATRMAAGEGLFRIALRGQRSPQAAHPEVEAAAARDARADERREARPEDHEVRREAAVPVEEEVPQGLRGRIGSFLFNHFGPPMPDYDYPDK